MSDIDAAIDNEIERVTEIKETVLKSFMEIVEYQMDTNTEMKLSEKGLLLEHFRLGTEHIANIMYHCGIAIGYAKTLKGEDVSEIIDSFTGSLKPNLSLISGGRSNVE